MKIDLSNLKLYDADELDLATKVNYIFGKNGTGKSTLTRLIAMQCREQYDVRVFQGFESIIGENHKLGAVVLGVENTEIQGEIDSLNADIETYRKEIDRLNEKITPPKEEGADNLYTESVLANEDLNKPKKKLDKLGSDIAKTIKERTNPQIAPNYRRPDFDKDCPNAKRLSDIERDRLSKFLMSEPKIVSAIAFPLFDMEESIQNVNTILSKKVEPQKLIARIGKNSEKYQFAKIGMRIHEKGDVCAFCGNPISDAAYEELGSFFSAEETLALEQEIESYIEKLKEVQTQIRDICIDKESFYPDYSAEAAEIAGNWSDSVLKYFKNIDLMIKELEDKKKHLFDAVSPMEITDRPFRMSEFQLAYSELCKKNNACDDANLRENARTKLRLDAVYTELQKTNYSALATQRDAAQEKSDSIEAKIQGVKNEIGDYQNKIDGVNRQISELQSQTKNEQKLADNINKALSTMVSFELERYEDCDSNGYYRVRDKKSGESRPIDQLSTGEKNIIAFLYFMGKLNEITDPAKMKNRIIVFDDPLNSNDEMMQYMIADRLKSWIYSLKKDLNNTDTIVILTHNIRFYTQLCGFYKESEYQESTIYHFEKLSPDKTTIRRVTCRKEDRASAYEEDWKQLITLYQNDEVSAECMLNLMRKIIETYTSFNKVDKYQFCKEVSGTMMLLHSNSHGEIDLDASANGFSKSQILKIFYDCFAVYKSGEIHIKRYWPGIEELVK